MTTYYVSSIVGSDNNAGTSSSGPLASLQAAENLVRPGDTVEVMNGTYTGGAGGNVLTLSTSGTASAPITFEAAPGATPVIDSSGTWQGIELDASYITIKGLTIVGDAANYNLSSATAGYSTGNADLDGNGIAATSGNLIHNIIIENNTIYNEPGGGIAIANGDDIQILNNNVHDNAHWSAYGASGIEVGVSQNFDTSTGPHVIISGNTSVNNAELVPEYRANAITDGEGIILDSNSGYTGGFLVQNNTTHGNSGPGIESFHSDNAVINGNTATGDLTNPNLVSEGEIFINQSNNNTVSNNITTAAPPPPPSGQLITNGSFETHDFGGWTLGGNSGPSTYGAQIFIDANTENGTYAAGLGSMGSDGTLSQAIATTAGQTYTLSFWLQNEAPGTNDFKAIWNGQTLVSLSNAAQSGYRQYTYSVAATGSASTLEFSARNDPSQWDLDNVSLTASGTTPTPPTTTPTATPASDAILWQNANGQAAIWEMNGTNVIADPLVGANPGPSWQAIGTGDFTDDGQSDILWQNASTGQASIWEMNGTNVIGGGLVGAAPGPSWQAIGTGDFNDDGHSDILWQNTSTGQASIWEMNGTNVIGGGLVGAAPGPDWKVVGTGDFNDDGHSDILWQNTSTGQASIWEMNGTNVIGGGLVGAAPGPDWKVVGTGDFNDDGHSDILWQNVNTGQASIWELNGTNVIGNQLVGAAPGPSWKAIGTGDYNGDGHSDILWQNTSSGQASIWEMNGTNVIGGGLVGAAPGPSWRAVG